MQENSTLHWLTDPLLPEYQAAIELVRTNPFKIQEVNPELVDERLLRFARKGSGWAPDVWLASLPKEHKALKERARFVFVDIGIVRPYADIF